MAATSATASIGQRDVQHLLEHYLLINEENQTQATQQCPQQIEPAKEISDNLPTDCCVFYFKPVTPLFTFDVDIRSEIAMRNRILLE